MNSAAGLSLFSKLRHKKQPTVYADLHLTPFIIPMNGPMVTWLETEIMLAV